MNLLTVGRILLTLLFVGSLGFAVTYQLTARWWKTDIGRNQMVFSICECAVVGISMVAAWWGRFPGQVPLSLGASTVFTAAVWWRWSVLLRAQAGRRHRNRALQDRADDPARAHRKEGK